MTESDRHVDIQERIFGPIRFQRQQAVLNERLLIAAVICFTQAVVGISCGRDLTAPVHLYGTTYSYRVGFAGYVIDPGGGIGNFLWTTTNAVSTCYKWREHIGPGAWVDHVGDPGVLETSHSGLLTGPFAPDVEYEFMPYGVDSLGVTHEGRKVLISISAGDWFLEEME
jgi:hypothetical protein